MEMRIEPRVLQGRLAAIPAKSHLHRLLICASLADQPTAIEAPLASQDIEATSRCLRALGAGVSRVGSQIRVRPIAGAQENPLLDCGESGSTLRFLLPVATALTRQARFAGSGRLPERPISHLLAELTRHGVDFTNERLPLASRGQLRAGDYRLPGNISSQYISGLLLALPKCPGPSTIRLITAVESAAYIDITLATLAQFGVSVSILPGAYGIPVGQRFRSPGRIRAEGDWSNAAFFLAAGALAGEVTVSGLDQASPQGDKQILAILKDFGAEVRLAGDSVTVRPGQLRGRAVDISQAPDLLPVLAVVAAAAQGESRFLKAGRLRLKESDRLAASAALVRDLGGAAYVQEDCLVVGGGGLKGGLAESSRDHRMAMAAAVAAICCQSPVRIRQAEAVEKSYPSFFEDYRSIGGQADEL